eukprot:6196504-Prymnesium_polylepis.1
MLSQPLQRQADECTPLGLCHPTLQRHHVHRLVREHVRCLEQQLADVLYVHGVALLVLKPLDDGA